MTVMEEAIDECEIMAHRIRTDCLRVGALTGVNGAHFGGSLSLVEIMAVLYGGILNIDPLDPLAMARDRVILSKGHGALAMYAALKERSFVTDDELMTFKGNATFLYGHPSMNPAKGIEFSSGSLGLGLSLGLGVAMALQRRGNLTSRVFVIVGDGECNEGSIWEAATTAAHFAVGNLVCIVDQNGLQYDGPTREIQDMGDLEAKWRAFGWDSVTVDGHNVGALLAACQGARNSQRPTAIVARTVKGKGVSFMENDPAWHHARLSEEQLQRGLHELEGEGS